MITKAFFSLCFVALLGQLLSVPLPQQPGKKEPDVFVFCNIFKYYLTYSKLIEIYYDIICLQKELMMSKSTFF